MKETSQTTAKEKMRDAISNHVMNALFMAADELIRVGVIPRSDWRKKPRRPETTGYIKREAYLMAMDGTKGKKKLDDRTLDRIAEYIVSIRILNDIGHHLDQWKQKGYISQAEFQEATRAVIETIQKHQQKGSDIDMVRSDLEKILLKASVPTKSLATKALDQALKLPHNQPEWYAVSEATVNRYIREGEAINKTWGSPTLEAKTRSRVDLYPIRFVEELLPIAMKLLDQIEEDYRRIKRK